MSKSRLERSGHVEREPKTKVQRTRGTGRPSYLDDPDFMAEAVFLARAGYNDVEMARELGCSVSTLYLLRAKHPRFSEAVRAAKDAIDDRVERAYLLRATGFEHEVEKVFSNGHRAKVREYVLPDTGAAANWLANRRREWNKAQQHELIVPITEQQPEGDTDIRHLALAAIALLKEAENATIDGVVGREPDLEPENMGDPDGYQEDEDIEI